jgi:hypothetical protein
MRISTLTVKPGDLPMKVKLLLGRKENEYILHKTKRGKLRLVKKTTK